MKFMNDVPEIDKVALSMMIFSTCGEDADTLANTVVEAVDGRYHITYDLDNPLNAMDFYITIEQIKNELGTTKNFRYVVSDSVYGDNGEFILAIS